MKFNIYNVKLKIDKHGDDVIVPYEKDIKECLSRYYYRNRTDVIIKLVKTIDLKELHEMYDVGEVLIAIEDEGYFSTSLMDKKDKKIANEKKEYIFDNLKNIEQALRNWL